MVGFGGLMIYQITIATDTRRNVCIYAHPEWDHVIDAVGRRVDDFTVLFVKASDGMKPRVFRRLPPEPTSNMTVHIGGSHPSRIYEELTINVTEREETVWELVTIDPIPDLRAYG
jgi:hypothetical protein